MTFTFSNRQAFHDYLVKHSDSNEGIWISFSKNHNNPTLSPHDALLEALSFGWIDGQIKKIDDSTYIKYFKKRSKTSIWSTRNKGLATDLIKSGQMMPSGLYQIELAKKDGRWEKSDQLPTDFSIDAFKNLLKSDPTAYQNFIQMSPSIQKTYVISYYILKKPESRSNRLKVIIERLLQNLKPM